ncbi:zinc finger protein 286A-like [Penaeus monodon]|uniref:zinc finger protein 286A-like n=1 Tax=Penaeus monodon TaxID=6687 RepID=UPI0018A74618|nr:zinc finger protein 286A-like [Penaeus monodon]
MQECDRQKKEDYMLSLTAWTKRLPALGNGVLEPFKKVEATLHKDLSAELGIETDKGIFFSLHQQGVAKGVRVVETGPEQIVVSGSLVELLASRDMILSEIEKIKGTCSLSTSVPSNASKTCEVGVMCELIPSPPSARYASSVGLDRSARRYHSVLSRPISPEPRPQRKRSRRQLSLESKLKSTEKQEDVSQRRPDRSQSQRSESQTLRTLKIKLEKDHEEKQTEEDYLVPKESNHNVEILLGDLKMEPECDETIIVSSISNSDLGEESHEVESISKSNSLIMHKDCDGYVLPLVNKDISVKNVEGRGQELMRRLEVESSNKENIKMDNSQFLYKPKEQVENEEDLDMEVEDHKIICEPEINMSEDQDDDLTKGHSAEEVKFKFSCQICSYKSMRENHFVKHMKLHDKGIALYRCNECSFVSIRASHLRRHKMSHAQQVLNCHLCSYTCDEQKLLAKHVRVKHQTPKPKQITSDVEAQALYECKECEYKTSWHYAYQRHRRTHTASKVVRIHTCPQCPYKTMRREHFLRHIKNVHQNHRPFLCDICGKAFKRQDALKQHHVTHYQSMSSGRSGQIGPYGFVCHICQKVCRSAAYLKEHMATHSEERSFLCEVCGASFKTRSVQRNHVQTIHRRPRSFTCPSCEKKFNTKYALRRHMKQHDTSLEDAEVLTGGNNELRLCDLQPRGSYASTRERTPAAPSPTNPPHTGSPSRTLLPPPAAPPSASAYQITIDGQPAFILPHLDGQHAAVSEGGPALMEENNGVIVGGDSPGGSGLRRLAGQGAASTAISVPVVPTTVHIVNQDPLSSASGDLILSSEQYQANQAASVVASEPPSYVAPEHPGSTLLYLTGNFS